MKSLKSDEERYFKGRIADLTRDVASARERGRRDHAVNLLIGKLVTASDVDDFARRLANGTRDALRATRVLVADEYGEARVAIRIAARMPRGSWPETVRIGLTTDLNVPFFGGSGTYVAAALGTGGYLYADGIEEVDGLALSARVIADTAALVAEAIAARAELADLAFTDLLTGIPNRLGFVRAMTAAIERNEPFGLVYVDLDGFKQINDTQGHEAGDRHLQKTAKTLRTVVFVAGRLGGDEFVGLVRPGADLGVIAGTLSVAGIACSLGVSHFPNDGVDVEALLRVADHSMYDEKRRRKRTV